MENIRVEDFLPTYPYINTEEQNPKLNPYPDTTFTQALTEKVEFLSLQTGKKDVKESGELLYNHQRFISRFISSHTPYDGILLVHEMGTGKTCAALGSVEAIRKSAPQKFNGALVLTKSNNILNTLIESLGLTCSSDEDFLLPDKGERVKMTEKELISKIRKKAKGYYRFDTFERFALSELAKKTDEEVEADYSNKVIVLDEVHNLKRYGSGTNKKSEVYNQFWRLMHIPKNCKKIIMSGTPMTDSPIEIANVLNLILPEEKQLPFNREFENDYFVNIEENVYRMKPDMINNFKETIKGYVSFLRSSLDIDVKYVGRVMPPMNHFVVYPSVMSEFQVKSYREALNEDRQKTDIYANSVQATLFVYPDGSYGNRGLKKYSDHIGKNVLLKNTLINEIRSDTHEKTLRNLEKFSCIYAATIRNILENTDKNTIVFNSLVEGSGCILFGKLMQLFGFKPANGTETTPGKRYAILTSGTLPDDKGNRLEAVKRVFNSEDNATGELIQVIIFSEMLSEGVTFKNVRRVHIQTPHWNYSQTSQAMARGIRLNAHSGLIEMGIDPEVEIFQHAAMPPKGVDSIDILRYTASEEKDISIKKVERFLKEAAVDCFIFYERNFQPGQDNTRMCDYSGCEYRCDGIIRPPIPDFSTYNLYYSDKEIKTVIAELKSVFINSFSISIEALVERIRNKHPNITFFQVCRAIRKVIAENIPMNNAYRFGSYIKEFKSILFLTENLNTDSDIFSLSYTQNPVGVSALSFNEAVEKNIVDKVAAEVYNATSYDEFKTAMDALGIKYHQMFLRAALQSPVATEKVEMTLEYFKGSYSPEKDYYRIGDFSYELKGGKWEEAPLRITRTKIDTPNPFGITGEFNPKEKIFWVRIIKKTEKDSRRNPPGKECKNYSEEELAYMCTNMGVPYNTERTEHLTAEKVWELLGTYKKFRAMFKEDDPIERLRAAYFYIAMLEGKKPAMCKLIYDFLKSKGLLDENSNRPKGYRGTVKKGV
jgi:hypothetical protein